VVLEHRRPLVLQHERFDVTDISPEIYGRGHGSGS
jgi:hypothetical protein